MVAKGLQSDEIRFVIVPVEEKEKKLYLSWKRVCALESRHY